MLTSGEGEAPPLATQCLAGRGTVVGTCKGCPNGLLLADILAAANVNPY